MLFHVEMNINHLRILVAKPVMEKLIGDLFLQDEVDEQEEDNKEIVLHFKEKA